MTTGVTGGTWRATVGPTGTVEPWSGPPLAWYVAAEDRWHDPAIEASVRQRRLAGTPVTETRVRVPTGDVVQHVYSVADAGGVTIVQVTNESTLPVAIAFDRRDVLTERPIADVPIEGIDLPADAFVVPLAHRASIRIGLAHGAESAALGALPSVDQVVAGWRSRVDRASRFVVPDGSPGAVEAERLVALRCELLLSGPPEPDTDPAGFLSAVGELVRMGDPAPPWVEEVAVAVERVAPVAGWAADVALDAAERTLAETDERRASADLRRILEARTRSRRPGRPPDGPSIVPWFESSFVADGELFPEGIPEPWWGQPIEAHAVPSRFGSTVSFALRWHGERPAVLWEQDGRPVTLTSPTAAPGWSASEVRGEALWPPPRPA